MTRRISSEKIYENIHQFLTDRTNNLERTNPELYQKIIQDFCHVKNKKYDSSVLSEKQIYAKQKESFYNWKRRENYQIEDLEILFNPETLNADFGDIFGEEYTKYRTSSSDHNYYRYISYRSLLRLRIYLDEQLRNQELSSEDRKQLIQDLSEGIVIPILYHYITQSFLVVQFSVDTEEITLSQQIIGFSLSRMQFCMTDDKKTYLLIPPENIRTYEQFRHCIESFKRYCGNLTHHDRISRLGSFIKNHPLDRENDDYQDYSEIAVKEPVFNMFRSVVNEEVKSPSPGKRKRKKSFDEQRRKAEKQKSSEQ